MCRSVKLPFVFSSYKPFIYKILHSDKESANKFRNDYLNEYDDVRYLFQETLWCVDIICLRCQVTGEALQAVSESPTSSANPVCPTRTMSRAGGGSDSEL